MSLAAQAKMVNDDGLLGRIAAAASILGVREAMLWSVNHAWLITAQPGWSERYAEASKNDEPVESAAWYGVHGINPDVIPDEWIMSAVATVLEQSSSTEPQGATE